MPERKTLGTLCSTGASREAVRQALPGRTDSAVDQKATELGLVVPWMRVGSAANENLDLALKERLSEGCEKGAMKELANQFNVPPWLVSRRAGQLGLSKARLKEPDWTDPEVEIVDIFGEEGAARVHRELRLAGFERSVGSVSTMVRRRQIEKLAMPSMSARGVAEMMGVDGKTVVRWIEVLGLKARQVDGTWRIGKRELRKWIFDNPTSFDMRKVRQEWFLRILQSHVLS